MTRVMTVLWVLDGERVEERVWELEFGEWIDRIYVCLVSFVICHRFSFGM